MEVNGVLQHILCLAKTFKSVYGRNKSTKPEQPCCCELWEISVSILGFPCGLAGKESACNAGDLDLISGLGSCPGEGISYPLQYSGLEDSMDCIVHGVTGSQRVRHD